MKKIIFVITLFIFIFCPSRIFAQTQTTLEGTVEQISNKENLQTFEIRITKGDKKGEVIKIDSSTLDTSKQNLYKKGDKLLIMYSKNPQGQDFYYIADKIRRAPLYILFGLFILFSIIIGRKQGIFSLLGMGVSFLVIFSYILPQIVAGQNPVLTTIIGSIIIIPITFSLSHGFSAKTVIAMIATIIALILTGLLSYLFVIFTSLTGMAAEETTFLQADIGSAINFQGILLAGIIIAALGVLDDVTVAQASLVQELKRANEKFTFFELFKRGMNVGRDHIGSVINTLVLVYTGASLPLLLLFSYSEKSFSEVVNYEIIATEIVKMLTGSIGLILTVPITTLLAAYYFQEMKLKK